MPLLQLPIGSVSANYEAILDGQQIIGAVVRFSPVAPACSGDNIHTGWARLTDAERAVADLVAAGYTNREAATKPSSPPTPWTTTFVTSSGNWTSTPGYSLRESQSRQATSSKEHPEGSRAHPGPAPRSGTKEVLGGELDPVHPRAPGEEHP